MKCHYERNAVKRSNRQDSILRFSMLTYLLTTDCYRNNAQKIQQSIQQAGKVKPTANIIGHITQPQSYQVVEA